MPQSQLAGSCLSFLLWYAAVADASDNVCFRVRVFPVQVVLVVY